MKYVVKSISGSESIYLFPRDFDHSYFADILSKTTGGEVVSAGFAKYDDDTGEMYCYGKSTTLKMTSRPTDTALLKRHMADH